MLVSEAVATAVARLGVDTAFGLAGSGNFLLINALRSNGVDYHGACHEAGAVAMADGYARVSGRLGVATVHQGPGLTNTVTALTEAVRSRTPLVVLAPEASAHSAHANQALDQGRVVRAVGTGVARLEHPGAVAETVGAAFRGASAERRPVVLMLPVEVLEQPFPEAVIDPPLPAPPSPAAPAAKDLAKLADAIHAARRPLILAGRGAVISRAGPALRRLAERAGALLATTLAAKGLFSDDRFEIGFLGGLASPLATELAQSADLLMAFGTSLDPWTTCGGLVPGPDAEIALVDDDRAALARHQRASRAIVGDARSTAEALAVHLEQRPATAGWRTPELAARLGDYRRADEIPASASELLDPRRLALALNRRLPADRVVALDSGHFLAFASIYIDSPDGRSFPFAQGFQSVGLGLGIGIGAAVGRRDRIVTVIMGDGGARMSLLELETAVRYALPIAVVVFDDGGYGAEVHDFEPLGVPVEIARFPCRDYAGLGRAVGAEGTTVRSLDDLAVLTKWAAEPTGPIVLDCKVDPAVDAVSVLTDAGATEWSVGRPAQTQIAHTTEEYANRRLRTHRPGALLRTAGAPSD